MVVGTKGRVNKVPLGLKKVDKPLLILTLVLTGLGLLAVADASAPAALNFFGDQLYFFKQQAIWAVIGICGMVGAIFIDYKYWEKIATLLFFVTLIPLVTVLIPGVGSSLLGARRWIIVGPLSFQPSELVKLSLGLYLAKVASKDKGALSYFLPFGIVAALIMLQPDLGTTIIVSVVAFLQIFVSGVRLLPFFAGGGIAASLGAILILISDYRRSRFLEFIETTKDPLSSAYHLRQVLLALGSGGLFGVGLGHSRQKYLFLPEASGDSIFAVIGEELGFLGCIVLIALIVFFVLRGIRIAQRAPDKFASVLAVGIVSWIGIQTFLNIGSMVAIIPLTGVPLPFISYGGTALVTVLFATGILLNISRHERH